MADFTKAAICSFSGALASCLERLPKLKAVLVHAPRTHRLAAKPAQLQLALHDVTCDARAVRRQAWAARAALAARPRCPGFRDGRHSAEVHPHQLYPRLRDQDLRCRCGPRLRASFFGGHRCGTRRVYLKEYAALQASSESSDGRTS